jgi:hypothetical protein
MRSQVPTASPTAIAPSSAVVRLSEPPIELTLPEGWREVPISELKELAETLDRDTPVNARFIDRVTGGRLLTSAEGFTRKSIFVQLELLVERDETSVKNVLRTVSDDVVALGVVETAETGSLNVPIGQVTWVRYLLKLQGDAASGAIPADVMVYLVPLEGVGTLVIESVGPQTDESHRDMLAEMLSTLRVHDGAVVPATPVPRRGGISDPNVEFVYPDRFVPVPMDGYREYLTRVVDLPAADRTEVLRLMDEIDRGVLRARMSSTKPLGFGEHIDIKVNLGDFNWDRTLERVKRDLGDPIIDSQEELDLPIGRAVAFSFGGEKQTIVNGEPISIPLTNAIVVVSVPDGRTMTIAGLGPQSDDGFGEVTTALAASLEVPGS